MSALVIMACSASKLPHSARAVDLYQGVMFDVLRKYLPEDSPPDVMIISAKYGLLMADDEVAPYDQRMDAERAGELIAEGLSSEFQFDGAPYDSVFIAVGSDYRRVAEMYVQELRAIGQITPDAGVTFASGGIGFHRQQLGQYLRAVECAA